MRYIQYTPDEVEVLMSCLLLAREAFTLIRNLGLGRLGLYDLDNPSLDALSEETVRQNLNIAGQLAEAMHHLPVDKDSVNDLECMLLHMEQFLSKNPPLEEQYRLRVFSDGIKESIS
ncbi:hypothetical protein [Neisseria sp. 83E34]|uniref:hypothetical protein n=1 Tax=Neisseria sp. 83E34 TaxID=1692264 RepID=UPI0006CEA5F8|nr:hypothetical protein [Neisseria sp. 83E34]KPN72663.1 hypothetical protein AKG09_02220 [Neisseria sp. 83E34]